MLIKTYFISLSESIQSEIITDAVLSKYIGDVHGSGYDQTKFWKYMHQHLVLRNSVTPIPVLLQHQLERNVGLSVHDAMHINDTVIIIKYFMLLDLDCITKIHGDFYIRLSLWFQRDLLAN